MSMTAEERAASLCEFHSKSGFDAYCGYCQDARSVLMAHANAALERVAEIVRMYKVANFSIAPHHRLVPAEPDAASETMAAAIRALKSEEG